MKFRKIPLLILSVLSAVALVSFTKVADDPIKKIVEQLNKWTDQYPQEKVYLHLDKPYYAVGDDIWFKAYVTVGPKHQLSALSGALNVELINPKDSIVRAIKLELHAGTAIGDFALSDTLKEGNYRIRAYTNWMRNAGPDYFYDKTIRIGNAVNSTVFTNTNFKYNTQNGQQTVNATISYTDLNGAAYANRELNYQVVLNNRDVAKGKAVTDNKGVATITFTNTMPSLLKSGQIITRLHVGDKQTVTRIIPVAATSGHVDVQFFPEGGYLVNGLPSKVGFKAVGADGLGKNISGVVVDNDNQEAAQLTTSHLGMGVFMLVPQPGKTYQARVTFEDGSSATIPLPKAQNQGYTLTINNTADADNINVRISASLGLVGTEINLVAQSGGEVLYASKNNFQGQVLATRIPKNKFPSGIVQFTLFNANGEPLNERIVFVDRPDQLKIDIHDAEQSYTPRSKANLQLYTTDPDGKPVMAVMSAAVINESKVPVDESDETTILSQLLLSSDIKGYIEKPNYYFTHTDQKTQNDLDVLMLTQGYRRFEWKQVLADNFPPLVYKPEKTLQISGHVHNGKKPVVHGKVTLFSTSGGTFILDTLTDEQGNFKFSNLMFTDSVKFLIQARTEKNKRDVEIELDNIAPQIVTPNNNAADVDVNISSTMQGYLQTSNNLYHQQLKYGVGNHNIVLKEVNIREKRKPLVDHSTNLNGPGNADQIITSDYFDKMGCSDLANCLQGRLLGVVFRNGIPYSTRSINTPMLVVLDGMEMSDADIINTISPYDISSIEVLRTIGYTAIYGSRGGGGVLVINTKRGNEGSGMAHVYAPGVMTYMPRGYYQARVFYSPQYDDPKTNAELADLRTTIYWKPNILTDKDGKASIGFFNATKGTYRVVIEGIDGNGHIGRQVLHYTVQ